LLPVCRLFSGVTATMKLVVGQAIALLVASQQWGITALSAESEYLFREWMIPKADSLRQDGKLSKRIRDLKT